MHDALNYEAREALDSPEAKDREIRRLSATCEGLKNRIETLQAVVRARESEIKAIQTRHLMATEAKSCLADVIVQALTNHRKTFNTTSEVQNECNRV